MQNIILRSILPKTRSGEIIVHINEIDGISLGNNVSDSSEAKLNNNYL